MIIFNCYVEFTFHSCSEQDKYEQSDQEETRLDPLWKFHKHKKVSNITMSGHWQFKLGHLVVRGGEIARWV